MNDMTKVIVPKSDQINADDLLGGPITITINDVKIAAGQEQPVSIYFDGSTKAYRCCKSMSRVLVAAWGADAKKYVGRSLTLYCDPKVKWGGMEVGGIRISHMSDIDSAMTMALTVTRANKKPFTVKPLKAASGAAAPKAAASAGIGNVSASASQEAVSPTLPESAATTITPDEAMDLEARLNSYDIKLAGVKKFFKVERLSALTPAQLVEANAMIATTIQQRKDAAS